MPCSIVAAETGSASASAATRESLTSRIVALDVRERRQAPLEGGRYLAKHIPGARIVEVSGRDHFPWVGDTDAILDEVEAPKGEA